MTVNDLRTAFPNAKIPDFDDYFSGIMEKRLAIYGGNPPWLNAKRSGLHTRGERRISQICAAKAICEEFAALTFAEQFKLTAENPDHGTYLREIMSKTRFMPRLKKFLSDAYALGGGAIKVYVKEGVPCIEFISADKIYPAAFSDGRFTEVIFRSQSLDRGKFLTCLERYKSGETENLIYESDDRHTIGRLRYSSGVISNPAAGIFSVFTPAVSNNFDVDSPLGISIIDNSTDILKAIDIAFDSLIREFILGKKRIIVPAASIQTVIDPETGNLTRYFDADDEAFVALKTEDTDALKITDNTVELRVEEHVSAINALFNLLCFSVGVSGGTFALNNSLQYYTKTATEVISQNSKSVRTIRTHQNALSETIADICRGLIKTGIWLGEIGGAEGHIDISWNDNVITADSAESN
jgi:A118 family predicted phage portal protein